MFASLTLSNICSTMSPMLDVAIHRLDGQTVVDLGRRGAPPLPVSPAFGGLLPAGLRRGSTVSVLGSVSLLLALLGDSSAAGAWCALVGMPMISAEAAAEYGIDLARLAIVPSTGAQGAAGAVGAAWTTAVGALLDAVDIVAARPPPRLVPGDIRRLAARARTRDSVLIPFLTAADSWPGADVRLTATDARWSGLGSGHGRLKRRLITVSAEGRGQAARPRTASLWLPAANGGVELAATTATVQQLPRLAARAG
jgi:hypothetical protein